MSDNQYFEQDYLQMVDLLAQDVFAGFSFLDENLRDTLFRLVHRIYINLEVKAEEVFHHEVLMFPEEVIKDIWNHLTLVVQHPFFEEASNGISEEDISCIKEFLNEPVAPSGCRATPSNDNANGVRRNDLGGQGMFNCHDLWWLHLAVSARWR